MKTKNRLLLTSAMMLALIAVSGTTATYAWWTTAMHATATVTEITANADASLILKLKDGKNVDIADNAVTMKSGTTLTDVTSGDGKVFKKAVLNGKSQVANLNVVDIEKDSYSSTAFYAIRFTAEISMDLAIDTAGPKYQVYLGDGDATRLITEKNDAATDKSVRMAVTKGDSTFIVGNEAEGNVYYQANKYESETNTGKTALTANYHSTAAPITELQEAVESPTFGDDNLYLGQLDGAAEENKTFDVTFTLWFEGAHTFEDVNEDEFDISLYFYCLRVVE